MPRLFGTAGIRGDYPRRVGAELAYKLGASLASLVGCRGSSVVGYDVRLTSQMLALSLASGLMSGGLDVYFLGLTPTPTLAYSTVKLGGRVGVEVTASHNPPEYNGFKCFDKLGAEFTTRLEVEVEKLLEESSYKLVSWDKVGKIYFYDGVVEDYIYDLAGRVEPSKKRGEVKVLVDPANGAASNVTPRVLRLLGAKVYSINSNIDGTFPGRHPEPRPDVLEDVGMVARSLNCHATFAHDGDADRLSVLDSRGNFVLNDTLIALYAKHKLSLKRGSVVISVDVSKSVEEVVEGLGGKIVRAKLGKVHEKLLEVGDAIMAAEPWKLIDPDWGLWVDGIYQAALLTSLMLESGKKIEELVKDIPRYPQKRLSYPVREEVKDLVYERICEEVLRLFKGYVNVVDIDGLKLEMQDNSWILVRKSGTEPKIRFYIEARNYKQLEAYTRKVEKIAYQTIRQHVGSA